ncbi:rRNA maturation RNase YbeY [Winogradskyella epiphytica]|uniref:Endoribonuclease YbeY n=1 Tax=Winogradskyella epiphytica TaxID=262005 RepID=A0A2V4X088_9FLAO|nr:rRNA maturation RNase YbeY [Winogradskyella epiphytica]PYE83312.1 rRNA maturation RNase YbeY [Winogradskyella epiphytica]GGW57250.1 endoribonuclease YbeY [Winogradskyella epiphytica]
MISFNYETEFLIQDEKKVTDWIINTILEEGCKEGEIHYIFVDDDYLHKLNVDFLNHDTLTDIISFDYSVGKELHGEIYISIDRVKENAEEFKVTFDDELARVMIHGILHYCGYKDKSDDEEKLMRSKEDYYLSKR